jgi:1-acyl-sn-glycerol-3-phosphate acyltransferase
MSAWQYNVAADLGQSAARRWASAKREPDLLCYGLRSVGAVVARAWLATYCRLRIDGRENLPARGSFVLVSNHASHLDALCLLAALPLRRLHRAFPVAAADYFFASAAAGALSGVFMNALPFARKGRRVRQSLDECRKLLAGEGNLLIMFPEGTRSTSGEMGEFRGGVGELVAGTDVPVVPCYLDGAHRAWPKGAWVPRPRKLRLTISAPMRFGRLERNRENVSRIATELEAAVRGLAPRVNERQEVSHERSDRNVGVPRHGLRPRVGGVAAGVGAG